MPPFVIPPSSSPASSPDPDNNRCAHLRPLLSVYVDGETNETEAQQIEAHLATGCAQCESRLAFLRLSHQALSRAAARPAIPPAALSARIARATYARPTLADQVRAWLRPAPTRVALGGALAAAAAATVVMLRPVSNPGSVPVASTPPAASGPVASASGPTGPHGSNSAPATTPSLPRRPAAVATNGGERPSLPIRRAPVTGAPVGVNAAPLRAAATTARRSGTLVVPGAAVASAPNRSNERAAPDSSAASRVAGVPPRRAAVAANADENGVRKPAGSQTASVLPPAPRMIAPAPAPAPRSVARLAPTVPKQPVARPTVVVKATPTAPAPAPTPSTTSPVAVAPTMVAAAAPNTGENASSTSRVMETATIQGGLRENNGRLRIARARETHSLSVPAVERSSPERSDASLGGAATPAAYRSANPELGQGTGAFVPLVR